MDSFLQFYQLADEPFFDLRRWHRKISIRDQITRGALLAQRLHDWLGEASRNDPPVLVVGGGACGWEVTAQLLGLQHSVCLVDAYATPFRLQQECRTRWIDPVVYDWPLDHYKEARYPLGFPYEDRSELKFGFVADLAMNIVQRRWKPVYSTLLRRHADRLDYWPNTWAMLRDRRSRGNRGRKLMTVDLLARDGRATPVDCRAIVLAGGAGDERTDWPLGVLGDPGTEDSRARHWFFGMPFWGNDDLENLTTGQTVVISGSGDGGLQDLIRVATRQRSAGHLWAELGLNANSKLLHPIASAELRLERSLAWQRKKTDDQRFQQQGRLLHSVYEECAKRALSKTSAGIAKTLRKLAAAAPSRIHLLSPQPYYACHYPLNRFLAHLLELSLPGRIQVHWGQQLAEVHWTPRSEPPKELRDDPRSMDLVAVEQRAAVCNRYTWKVLTRRADGQGNAQELPDVAHRLVIRHGLDVRIPEGAKFPAEFRPSPNPEPPCLPSLHF